MMWISKLQVLCVRQPTTLLSATIEGKKISEW